MSERAVDPLNAALEQMDQELGIEPEAPAEGTPSDTEASAEPEVVADETGRLHDPETGKFIAKDKGEQPTEEAAEAPAAETVEQEAERLLAGKYRTPEELEHAYQSLQSRLGEQGSELGELRKTLDTLNERLAPGEPQVQLNQQTVDWYDEQVDTNPYAAVAWALQNDPSGALYNRGMDAWFEQNPRQAAAFERQLEVAQLREEMNERLTEQTQPLMEHADRAVIGQTWAAARAQLPDLDQHADQILEAAKEAPELVERLRDGTAEQRLAVIRNLYFLAKGRQTATAAAQTEQAASQAAQAARDTKLSGATLTQTQQHEPEKIDPDEQWMRDNLDPHLDRYMAPQQ